MNGKIEGAKDNMRIDHHLMNETLIIGRESCIGMEKDQHAALGVSGSQCLLKAAPRTGNQDLRGISSGHVNRVVPAAAVYHNDLGRGVRHQALQGVCQHFSFVQGRYDGRKLHAIALYRVSYIENSIAFNGGLCKSIINN